MNHYIINKNADSKGYNEVHTTSCDHLPASENQVDLGYHVDSVSAVAYAKLSGWKNADGCYHCCREAHTA